jgi:hypothetical protein
LFAPHPTPHSILLSELQSHGLDRKWKNMKLYNLLGAILPYKIWTWEKGEEVNEIQILFPLKVKSPFLAFLTSLVPIDCACSRGLDLGTS